MPKTKKNHKAKKAPIKYMYIYFDALWQNMGEKIDFDIFAHFPYVPPLNHDKGI